jgi:hypothetical protein
MAETKKGPHTGGMGLFIIFVIIFVGLILLFAWQTWSFVDWLFPTDQLLMKLLTVLCFDVLAVGWACLDLFYKFATRGSRTLVRWAWAISFILSLLASIFYLVIESMFRFRIPLTQGTVNIGYGVVIFAVTLQVLFVTFWIYIEWNARHPHQDEYEHPVRIAPKEPDPPQPVALAKTIKVTPDMITMSREDLETLFEQQLKERPPSQ